jgi:hypothetical protein
MRKVSAHGLGHLRTPYKADDAPADVPAPPDSVLRSGVERWHCDLWFQIVSAALAGRPDRPALHCLPELSAPAISRYGATAPELLRWFDPYNAERSYRERVKPFGFMLAMRAKPDWSGERIATVNGSRGRPAKSRQTKPVSPFDSDPATAAAMAFDRETGKPVPASALQTYAEALAQYHLHPESKFLGGDYCERGTTRRRHIRVSGVRHIGKESNGWEEQAVLGLDADAELDYGLSDDSRSQLIRDLVALVAAMGRSGASKALGIPPNRLRSLLNGWGKLDYAMAQTLAARLPVAIQLGEKLSMDRQQELRRLRQKVAAEGLRSTARQLKMDPSNLRRKLARRAPLVAEKFGSG